MKKYLIKIIIFSPIWIGCQPQPSNEEASVSQDNLTELEANESPKYTIPVKEAQIDIARYSSLMRHYDSILTNTNEPLLLNSPLKSFTIRSIDLIEALGMNMKYNSKAKFDYVRVYIGLDEENQFKLFLTPVEGADLDANPPRAGRDHILHKETRDEEGNLIGDEGYVMDFAKPCPNTCPDDILFN